MTIPVQITFRHMESSAAVETRIRELADHLGVFSDRILGCRVVLDSPHRHQHQGKVFNVKVTSVNTLNRQGKTRRTRTGLGKRKDTKRAIVSLAEGHRIDIFGGPVS